MHWLLIVHIWVHPVVTYVDPTSPYWDRESCQQVADVTNTVFQNSTADCIEGDVA